MHARASGRRTIDSSWRIVAVMRFSGGADGKEEEDGLCGGSEPPPMLRSLTEDWTSPGEAFSVIMGRTREAVGDV
jgi:hypothetical protein